MIERFGRALGRSYWLDMLADDRAVVWHGASVAGHIELIGKYANITLIHSNHRLVGVCTRIGGLAADASELADHVKQIRQGGDLDLSHESWAPAYLNAAPAWARQCEPGLSSRIGFSVFDRTTRCWRSFVDFTEIADDNRALVGGVRQIDAEIVRRSAEPHDKRLALIGVNQEQSAVLKARLAGGRVVAM